jgi:pimeloyl-ACP methyl ester carboxylesterase
MPTLLLVATRDRYVSPAMTSQVEQYVPQVVRHEVDAGHWAMWSKPAEIAAVIADFVRSQRQGPQFEWLNGSDGLS